MSNRTAMTHLVTLGRTASWEACHPGTGVGPQDWYAHAARFIVRSDVADHHGPWQTVEAAKRFASSCPFVCVVIEIAPYLWAPAYGRVPAAAAAAARLVE